MNALYIWQCRTYEKTGLSNFGVKVVRLAPYGTNQGLFQIRFQYIWPTFGPDLTSLWEELSKNCWFMWNLECLWRASRTWWTDITTSHQRQASKSSKGITRSSIYQVKLSPNMTDQWLFKKCRTSSAWWVNIDHLSGKSNICSICCRYGNIFAQPDMPVNK